MGNILIICKKIKHRIIYFYQIFFYNRHFVFQHDGPYSSIKRNDCIFKMYKSFSDIPDQYKESLYNDGGDSRLEKERLELEENAVQWLAIIGDTVVSTSFSRKGKYFKHWFLDLKPEDIVIFRNRTHPDFRGKGLAASLMHYAMYNSLSVNDHAYVDCHIGNIPSIRSIEKAGFKCIKKSRPISRDWAMGNSKNG